MESFPLSPDPEGYGTPPNTCDLIWPPDKTPLRLWIGLQGILRGAPWGPADPPPPFDVFPVDNQGGCTWETIHNGITFDLHIGPGGLVLSIALIPTHTFFGQTLPVITDHWFANSFQNPAVDKYYGGFAIVMSNIPDNGRSEQELIDLVGIPATDKYYSNPRPMTGEFAVHSIMSIANNDFIRIKVDHS
ncbi:hypothetical protein ES703_117429 [subsurface metagenome]